MQQSLVQSTSSFCSSEFSQQGLGDTIAHLCSSTKSHFSHSIHGSLDLIKIEIHYAMLCGIFNDSFGLSKYIKEADFVQVREGSVEYLSGLHY